MEELTNQGFMLFTSWMGLASIAFDPSPIVVARGCRRILGGERATSGPPVWRHAMLSQTMPSTSSFCAMLGSPRRSPSSSCGDETRMSQAMSSSAVSSRARVRGSPDTGLSVKKRRRREWLWKQHAAMPAALWSARSVSAMTHGGALVRLDPRRLPPTAGARRASWRETVAPCSLP
jgi:hypothetical protein